MITTGSVPLASEPSTAGGITAADQAVLLAAIFGTTIVLRDPCVMAISGTDLAHALPGGLVLAYDAGAKTLTVNDTFNLNDAIGESFAIGARFVFCFTSSDRARSGIYALTTIGDALTAPQWTRATDCDASGDLVTGFTVLVGTGSQWGIRRLVEPAPLTLDTSALSFEPLVAMVATP